VRKKNETSAAEGSHSGKRTRGQRWPLDVRVAATILQQDGTLAVTWLSRTLNAGPGALVPAGLRPTIVKAIEAATGRTVSAF
jgi:hypothetical protein